MVEKVKITLQEPPYTILTIKDRMIHCTAHHQRLSSPQKFLKVIAFKEEGKPNNKVETRDLGQLF